MVVLVVFTGLDVVCDGEMPFLSVLMKHSSDAKLLNKNELFVVSLSFFEEEDEVKLLPCY